VQYVHKRTMLSMPFALRCFPKMRLILRWKLLAIIIIKNSHGVGSSGKSLGLGA
jgi:hypothetical protein